MLNLSASQKINLSRICAFANHCCALVISVSVMSANMADVFADPSTPDVNKLKQIQAIIGRQGMEMPVHWQSRVSDKQLVYCSRFLDDIKKGKDIEVIEPIVSTDDPNSPSLARYRNACRNTTNPAASYHDLSDVGTHGFRLYRIPLDDNTTNASEDILYAEGNPRLFGNGTYRRVDLKQCTMQFVASCCSTALTPKDTRVAVTNVNAIIRYRKTLYVLEMNGQKVNGDKDFLYGINLEGPLGPAASLQCRFAWPYSNK